MNHLVVSMVTILFPGILSAIVADKITVHSKWEPLKFGVYALCLGILSYVTLQTLAYGYNCIEYLQKDKSVLNNIEWYTLNIWSIVVDEKPSIVPWEIVVATLLSIPVAFFSSFLINYKIFNKIAKKISITAKYGDENLFSFYLNAKEVDWIYIRDIEANITYQGQVISYSENEKIQEIVLAKVTLFKYEDSEELYSVPSIYITKEMGKFIIEAIPPDYLGDETNDREKTTE